MKNTSIVSFDDEQLVLVNDQDEDIGYDTKSNVHAGDGVLHRAFSLFIFNDQKELLIQKRSDQKLLWPNFWSNSVCSHPRKGENIDTAIHRRLNEELGIDTELNYIFKFMYHATFSNIGSEKELCYVYFGKSNNEIVANQNEISEWKFMPFNKLVNDLHHNTQNYTPWITIEIDQIVKKHKDAIDMLLL